MEELFITITAMLLLKVISYLSELKISLSSLYQLIIMGCDPATRASIFNNLPSVSSRVSEGFLVKLGGIFCSRNNNQSCTFNLMYYNNTLYCKLAQTTPNMKGLVVCRITFLLTILKGQEPANKSMMILQEGKD